MRVLYAVEIEDLRAVERYLHTTLRHRKVRTRSEWFALTADEATTELEHAVIVAG